MCCKARQAVPDLSLCATVNMCWQENLCRPAGDVLKDWRARYFVLEVLPVPRLCYYRALETGEGPAGELPLDGSRVQVGISHHSFQPGDNLQVSRRGL